MGFTPSLLKKRVTERCSSLVHVASGPPSLHYYCAVVLHSCTVLPPVDHSSNHQYHCRQLTRQSSCVSNFYRTLKVFRFTLPRICGPRSVIDQKKIHFSQNQAEMNLDISSPGEKTTNN
jgi:hypothetical protein